jgi:hypothetical protein
MYVCYEVHGLEFVDFVDCRFSKGSKDPQKGRLEMRSGNFGNVDGDAD